MSAITFDTHKVIKELQSAGVPPAQAEAFVRVQQDILAQAIDTTVASRADLATLEKALHADTERVERKLIEHDGEFKSLKWMLGILLGGVISLVLKSFF